MSRFSAFPNPCLVTGVTDGETVVGRYFLYNLIAARGESFGVILHPRAALFELPFRKPAL